VIAVGEVKSDIDSTSKLSEALAKLASVKSLDRSNRGRNRLITGPGVSMQGIRFDPATVYRDQILGFIFTGPSLTKENLIKHLQHFNSTHPRRLWMNVYCDVGCHLISYESCEMLSPSAMDATRLYCTRESERADLLLLFYCIVATFVDQAHVARPDYFAYADIEQTDATYHLLSQQPEK
jgi:hypothetical protein